MLANYRYHFRQYPKLTDKAVSMNIPSRPLHQGLSLEVQRDSTQLLKLFNTVNDKHFSGNIKTNIHWASPEGSVTIRPAKSSYSLNNTNGEATQFDTACKLIEKGQASTAIPYLEPLAELEHRVSQLLLIHLLPPNSLQRQHLSHQYNLALANDTAVPAACYYPQKKLIVIHPFLLDKNAPLFVIKYLIYHECCHQLIGSTTHNTAAHPPCFMALEYNAPHRIKSLDWLEQEGFPTIRLTDPDHIPQSVDKDKQDSLR